MRWCRHLYQPCRPLGADGTVVTGSQAHIELSRQAADEGIVLLKNENMMLPLQSGSRVVLLGKASEEYVRGGGGSGSVSAAYTRSVYEGMKAKQDEGKVSLYDGLHAFYQDALSRQYADGREIGMTREPVLSDAQWQDAAAYSDTAIVCICRFSGEGWDRRCLMENEQEIGASECETWEGERALRKAGQELFPRGDFYLSDEEELLVKGAQQHFRHVIVTLNVGGVVDTSWFAHDDAIEAVVLAWQGGMEGALALADVLTGDVNPSGKLVDTFAARLEDYPSTPGFHESVHYVEYTEDIYVGYRYFETIPGEREKVVYPFGYGLSYTTFEIRELASRIEQDALRCYVTVKNTGCRAGKEVVQLYYSAPVGLLGKPAYALGAFAKTPDLKPGEECVLTLCLPVAQMASYDDQGLVARSAWVLEKGDYRFYIGSSVRDLSAVSTVYTLAENRVTEQLSERISPTRLSRRLRSDGSYETLYEGGPSTRPIALEDCTEMEGVLPRYRENDPPTIFVTESNFEDVAQGKMTLDAFMDTLSEEDMAWMLGGQPNTGVANTFGIGGNNRHHIPAIMTADGPAGLRLMTGMGIYTTSWPCATMLACTWNPDLVRRVGEAAALEIKENNIGIWLAPAMNIHRSPLCGRNFEYYSEDPLISGTMGTAMVQGVQSCGIAATVKHFALNNKETNRKRSDSIVSERAAREIYLKGFEMVVKQAGPWVLMTSYNVINGVPASENADLLQGILRGEWGFDGCIVTDWWNRSDHWREVKAGNDVKMGTGYPESLLAALKDGRLTVEDLRRCVKHVLELILRME